MSEHFQELIDNKYIFSITESRSIEILEMFANFFYKFETPVGFNFQAYATMYTLAKKYGIKKLLEPSQDRLFEEVNIDTAISCPTQAYSIVDVQLNLKQAIFKYILQNYEEISAMQSFLTLFDHKNIVKDLTQFMYENPLFLNKN